MLCSDCKNSYARGFKQLAFHSCSPLCTSRPQTNLLLFLFYKSTFLVKFLTRNVIGYMVVINSLAKTHVTCWLSDKDQQLKGQKLEEMSILAHPFGIRRSFCVSSVYPDFVLHVCEEAQIGKLWIYCLLIALAQNNRKLL